jgi:tetratricopeptide (TPR) repeat protein
VDLRPYRAQAKVRDPAFMALAADFAAAVRGMPKEDLLSQEVRQQRRNVALAGGAAAAMLVLAVLAGIAAAVAVFQRDRALSTLAAAIDNANGLVVHVAAKVRRTAGIPPALQTEILHRTRDLQEKLVVTWASDERLARSQAVVRRELAQTLLSVDESVPALQNAVASRAIMDRLLRDNPGDRTLRRELSRSHNRIGEAQSAAGRHREALEHYRQALAIRRDLVEAAADDDLRRDLALSLERVGDALWRLGNCDADRSGQGCEEARNPYNEGFEIRRDLARAAPGQTERQGDLAYSYERMGLIASDPDEQLAAYRESLALRAKLVQQEPNDTFWQRALAASYDRVGDALRQRGERAQAFAAFSEGLAVRETLAARNPDVVRWHTEIVVSLYHLARSAGEPKEAGGHLLRARGILASLRERGKLARSDEALENAIAQELERVDSDRQ